MCAMSEPSGPMEKGTTYIVRPFMAPSKRPSRVLAHLGRIPPVVGRAGVDLLLRADERPVLDPGHVAGVRVSPVAVGPLGVAEAGERAGVDQLLAEPVVLVGRAVAPLDPVGSGQPRNLVDPGQEFRVLGRRHIGGICSFVRPVSVGSNARHVPWDPPNLRTRPRSPRKTSYCSLFGASSGTESSRSGLRDDAGVVPTPDGGSLVVSVDSVVDGVHVDLSLCEPADVGWKALMQALSDLAAMGAAPLGALIALCVPAGDGRGSAGARRDGGGGRGLGGEPLPRGRWRRVRGGRAGGGGDRARCGGGGRRRLPCRARGHGRATSCSSPGPAGVGGGAPRAAGRPRWAPTASGSYRRPVARLREGAVGARVPARTP